jgi:hypothetical protein
MGMFRSRVIRWAAVPLFLAAIIMSGAGCGSINQAPIINGLNVSEDTVAPGAIVKLACNALDPEKRDLTYTWTASGGTITGESASATWTAPSAAGSYKITVNVTDPSGGKASKSADVYVQGGGSTTNSPPVIKSLSFEPVTFKYDDELVTVTCVAEDPDGDQIVSYTWTATDHLNQPAGKFSGDKAVVVWTPVITPYSEDCTISVYCTDSKGNRSGRKFFALLVYCDCLRPEVSGK